MAKKKREKTTVMSAPERVPMTALKNTIYDGTLIEEGGRLNAYPQDVKQLESAKIAEKVESKKND